MPGEGSRRTRRPESSPEQAVVEAVFRGIATLFRALFGRGAGRRPAVSAADRVAIQEHWGQVEFAAAQPNQVSQAIFEADKLLDHALTLLGVPGNTLGERLKAAQTRFVPDLYQRLWDAHKLRNALAHEVGYRLETAAVQRAVQTFREALAALGFL